jgi:hypothetical protein
MAIILVSEAEKKPESNSKPTNTVNSKLSGRSFKNNKPLVIKKVIIYCKKSRDVKQFLKNSYQLVENKKLIFNHNDL